MNSRLNWYEKQKLKAKKINEQTKRALENSIYKGK